MRRRLNAPLEPPASLGVGPSIIGRELSDGDGGRPTIWVSARRRDGSADPEACSSAARDRGGAAATGFGRKPREGSSHHTQGARNSECISIRRSAGILVIPNREVAGDTFMPVAANASGTTSTTPRAGTRHGNGRAGDEGGQQDAGFGASAPCGEKPAPRRVTGRAPSNGLPDPRHRGACGEGRGEASEGTSSQKITEPCTEGTETADGKPHVGQDTRGSSCVQEDRRGHGRPQRRPHCGRDGKDDDTGGGRSLSRELSVPPRVPAAPADDAIMGIHRRRHSRRSDDAAEEDEAGETNKDHAACVMVEGISPGLVQRAWDTATAAATAASQQCQQQRHRPHRGDPAGTADPRDEGSSSRGMFDVGPPHQYPLSTCRKRGRPRDSGNDSPPPPARRLARPAALRRGAIGGRREGRDDRREALLPARSATVEDGAMRGGPCWADSGAGRDEEEARLRTSHSGPSGAVDAQRATCEDCVPNHCHRDTDSQQGGEQATGRPPGEADGQSHPCDYASSNSVRRRLRGKQRPGGGHCQALHEDSTEAQAPAMKSTFHQFYAQGGWPADNSVHDSGYAGPSRSSHLDDVDRFSCHRDRDGQASVGGAADLAAARRVGGPGIVAEARFDHVAHGGRPPDAASGDAHPFLGF